MARPFDSPLTYAIPAWLQGELKVGHVVLIPLGRMSETGYVVGLSHQTSVPPSKIKPIARLLDPLPAFDHRQLEFFRWIAEYYLAPLGSVIQTALPSQVRVKTVRAVEPTSEGVEALTRGEPEGLEAALLRDIISRPGLTKRGLVRRMSSEMDSKQVDSTVRRLCTKGWVEWTEKELSGVKGSIRTVSLTGSVDEVLRKLPRAGVRMKALIRALAAEGGTMDVPALAAAQGSSTHATLRRMADKEVVTFGTRENRHALEEVRALGASTPPTLNAHQSAALEELTGPERAKTWLLFGVTGSGKTEVFLGAAQDALVRGQQVCVLVPEIGLTPQLVGRFKARFGDDVAVLHSGLTAADRLAHWRRLRAGEARVVVGARSALFAPFRDLGLIVVDEEHDDSYKQDEGVKYSARDLAVVLGKRWSCPVILASATPALESYQNAREGRYGLLRLPERATPRPVPTVELVNMTEVPKPEDGPRPLLAPSVVDALRQTFSAGGKAIVLYNRRGFATMVQCTSCGGTYECPNCGISMTLHQRAKVMACHYCGLKRPYESSCPVCRAETLEELGKGTERVEAELTALFPDVPQGRMDADTTAVRGAHHRILDDFRSGKTKLLTGTQIVAKGHDFPDVHLAVVVSADQGFRMPDFRAAERTYALLVQLAGRAGRGDVGGRVLVQTWKPEHYALADLDSVEAFYEKELHLRRVMRYPPYARLVLIRIDGPDRRRVLSEAGALARELREVSRHGQGVQILGPAPAALPRLVGRWRFQLIVRGESIKALRGYLSRVRSRLVQRPPKGVRLAVDVDPRHLM